MTSVAEAVRTIASVAISLGATGISLVIVVALTRVPNVTHEPSAPRVEPVEIAAPPPAEPLPREHEPVPSSPTPARQLARPDPAFTPAVAPSRIEPLSSAPLTGDLALPALGAGPSIDAPLPGLAPQAAEPAVDVPARPLVRPAPTYPGEARLRRIEGRVALVLRVDERGRVSDVHVKHAEPPGVFDEVARATAMRYRFEPARRGGRAIATTVEQDLVFRLRR